MATPTLFYACDFMVGLGKHQLRAKFEVASPPVAEILQRNPKFCPPPLFSGWDFMMGLGKPQLPAKFEVAGFIYYGNIREFVF